LVLSPTDLLRDAVYRRLWISILISSFGGQVTILALPLTAAVLMHASPTQMGALTAMEIVPFVLFSLPTGVWLDRLRKLPVYVMGELSIACAVTSVPLAWWLGWLSMTWLYVVGFAIGGQYLAHNQVTIDALGVFYYEHRFQNTVGRTARGLLCRRTIETPVRSIC